MKQKILAIITIIYNDYLTFNKYIVYIVYNIMSS